MKALEFANPYDPRETWAAHLQSAFNEAGIQAGNLSGHISESLALYCQEFHPRGVRTADLSLLIARTFCSVGDRDSAAKILSRMEPHSRHAQRWLEILSELHHFPGLLPYFTMGVIRPADWAGAVQDRMWTLDFGELTLSESERHEITLFRSIRTVVDKMMVFWDATGGEGTLGVKGLLHLAIVDAQKKSRTKKHPPGKVWIDYISDILRQQARHRNWRCSPTVISLDL